MKKTMGMLLLVAAITLAGSSEARAQASPDRRTFFEVNGGGQLLAPTLAANGTFLLFGETGVVTTRQDINPGILIDARLGHRIGPRLGIAIAVSGFRSESAGVGTLSIPSPIVVASPTISSVPSSALKRREIGYHPQLVLYVPWSEKFDVSIFAGPSFIHLEQNVIAASVAAGTQSLSVATANQSGMAIGGNAGIDATRPLSDRFGVGLFARYVIGRVDLPSATGVKVGGFQAGAGLRFRF